MDHFLDYLFLASIIIGYSLALPGLDPYWFLALLALGGAFMVNMFLSFAATNEFKISALGIGPTEIRIFFIVLNAAIIFFGSSWLSLTLPFAAAILTAFLAWMVFRTHQHLWTLDMEHKRSTQQAARQENPVS